MDDWHEDDWRLWWAADLLGGVAGRALLTRFDTPSEAGLELDGVSSSVARGWPEPWVRSGRTPSEARSRIDQAKRALRELSPSLRRELQSAPMSDLLGSEASSRRSAYVTWVGDLAETASLPKVAIVGTRNVAQSEEKWLARFLDECLRCVHGLVLSGGALGVDTLAHEAALRAKLPTWAVLAGGLAAPTPVRNRPLFRRIVDAGGVLLSERPPHRHPHRRHFLERNELVVALADLVIVARAPMRSGALHTARSALAAGVPVFAIPGRPGDANSEGTNKLLLRGARPLVDPAQLGDWSVRSASRSLDFGKPARADGADAPARDISMESPHRPLYELLKGGPLHRDQLLRALNASQNLDSSLLEAELSGRIERRPGGYFAWADS